MEPGPRQSSILPQKRARSAAVAPEELEVEMLSEVAEETPSSSVNPHNTQLTPVASVFDEANLLRIVLSQLDLQELCRASLVCRDWLKVCNSDEFWRQVSMEGRVCKPGQVVAVLKRHSGIERLDLSGVHLEPIQSSGLLPALQSQTRLYQLQIGASCISASGTDRLLHAAPLLRSFHARSSTFHLNLAYPREANMLAEAQALQHGRQEAPEVVFRHQALQELQLSACTMSSAMFDCPSLTSLSLADCQLASMRCASPLVALQTLDLLGCHKVSEGSLRSILCQAPILQRLNLSHVCSARTELLLEMAPCLRSLQSLTAHSCSNLALPAFSSLLSLTFLDLSHCAQLSNTSGVPAVGAWASLKELVLDDCRGLKQVTLGLPALRSISLQCCPALRSVQLAAPLLQGLQLGNAQYPGVPHLTSLDLASSCLKEASWRNLPYLESLQLACPALTSLHLACCDALPARALQTFTPTPLHVGCPNLQVLHLEMCEQLRSSVLTAAQLRQLTVTSCAELQSLSLSTPQLQGLFVEECKQLTSLVLESAAMDSLALGGCPSLEQLTLRCKDLQTLDVQGCGSLEMVQGACPTLHTVDAQFCHVLGSEAVCSMAACMPALCSLLLPYCTAVGTQGLAALAAMQHLHTLDLSFTNLKELEPLFLACPNLHTLKLQGCRQLEPTALQPLCPPPGTPSATVLPKLQSLDVSYCPLPCHQLAVLMQHATQLQSLAISGCVGATDELFTCVNKSQRAVLLHNLSAKHIKGLQACWLGLRPTNPAHLGVPDSPLACWQPAESAFAGLRALRLGLSGLRSLALRLPLLASLDLHGCHELRLLTLDCTSLLSLSCHSCRAIEEHVLEEALAGCPNLESADLLHSQAGACLVSRLSRYCPNLRTAAVS